MLGRFAFLSTLFSSIIVAPLWFYLWQGWPKSTDYIFYGFILDAFSQQFWAGELYPRWLQAVNAGLGSPVFLFYGPLPFWLLAPLEFLHAYDPHGSGRVAIGLQLALILGAFTMRYWLSQRPESWKENQGGLWFITFPYIGYAIYFAFCLSQLLATALAPLLLDATDRLIAKKRHALLRFALIYALMILTHIPTALIFGGVAALYGLMLYRQQLHALLPRLASAVLWAVTLAAVYILPALLNRTHVQQSAFVEHLVVLRYGYFGWSTLYGWASIVLPLLLVYAGCDKAYRQHLRRQPLFVAHAAVLLVLFFFTTPLSDSFWRYVPVLGLIQLPMRFFTAMMPSAILLFLWLVPQTRYRLLLGMITGASLFFAICLSGLGLFEREWGKNSNILFGSHVISAPEYATPEMERMGVTPIHLPELAARFPAPVMVEDRPRRMVLDIEGSVILHRLYFPGWQTNDPSVKISEKDALMVAESPTPRRVTLTLPRFAGEHEGALISLIAALGLLFSWLTPRKATHHDQNLR